MILILMRIWTTNSSEDRPWVRAMVFPPQLTPVRTTLAGVFFYPIASMHETTTAYAANSFALAVPIE
jgi:hypothetical protein